jgi:hypothetical protein
VIKRFLIVTSLVAIAAAVTAPSAMPARGMMKGIYDEANVLTGDPDQTFRMLAQLRTKAIRLNLHWGGRYGVAGEDPTVRPTDPNDGQYDWELYDRAMLYAAQYKIKVIFSIVGTPNWANGNKGTRVAPTAKYMSQLRDFSYAAALRYSGTYRRVSDGRLLPAVRHWLAWNEPNNPVWLTPQYKGRTKTIVSARNYAKMCNAIVTGVKRTLIRGEKVACGVTAPRGNNNPRSSRPSISPLAFMRAMKRFGARGFDAYAHHPYYAHKTEKPTSKPKARTSVILGNINDLVKEINRLYGKRVRVWITEFAYQTAPPRDNFGVTRAQQAAYLRQSYNIARRNPRIDMFLWFLLKDDTNPGGWQSGLLTPRMVKKPAFNVFRALP